jgi:hypothetical protein
LWSLIEMTAVQARVQTQLNISEDEGLFRQEMSQFEVMLTLRTGENRRGDWIVLGYLPCGRSVHVVFAGRRRQATARLSKEMSRRWAVARAEGDLASAETVTCPVRIEGCWRPVFRRDGSGCETREDQLMAARWTYFAPDGTVEVAGEPVLRADDITFHPMPEARRAERMRVIS